MAQKAEYRNSLRSKVLIRRSFIRLLRTKPLDKITVTDIVNDADINRGTFYAHYADIDSLIDVIEDEVIDALCSLICEWKKDEQPQEPLSLFQKISGFLAEDQELIFALMNANNTRNFVSRLPDLFTEHLFYSDGLERPFPQDALSEAKCRFYAAGIAHVYTAWFQGSLNGSLEDVAHHLSKIVEGQL